MTPKHDGYTIDLASGTETTKLNLKKADGSIWAFRLPVPSDKIKSLRLQKIQSHTTDEQLLTHMAELLFKGAPEGVSQADIYGVLADPDQITESARAQILDLLVNGRMTDPKVMGLLLDKLATKVALKLVEAI